MKMQNPYSVIGDAFVDSVVAGNRGKIEGKQEGLSDRLRQYAYYLTENMVEAGDALFVNDLLDAAKRLNPAPTGNAPEPVQKPVNKRDAMTVLHDSLQEWNTEEFCKSDWNTKAAQRAIKDLNRAGFFIGANDELALLKGFVSPRSSWAIYRDGEIVEVCFERGEAQAIFDGLQLDDEDQKYTWSMCQVRNNIGVVVAWRWRPKSRKADWDYTASAAWVEKYKTTIEAEPLYAAPASNPQEVGPAKLCSCKASERDGQHMMWCPVSSTVRAEQEHAALNALGCFDDAEIWFRAHYGPQEIPHEPIWIFGRSRQHRTERMARSGRQRDTWQARPDVPAGDARGHRRPAPKGTDQGSYRDS